MEVFNSAGGRGIHRHTIFYGARSSAHVLNGDVFSWTALISQYIKQGQPRQALSIYEEMRNRRVQPSSYTFVAALKACSRLQDIQSAKQIHSEVVKSGYDAHVYVGTMLVDAYVKCGSLVDAGHVFEKMPCRNVVSWNSMILGYAQMEEGERALQLFAQMQQEGVSPNDRTFVGALRACTSLMQREGVEPSYQPCVGALKAGSSFMGVFEEEEEEERAHWTVLRTQCLEQVKAIHLQVSRRIGLEVDVYLGTMLVDAYAKCGSLADARSVFDSMTQRNVVCWTAMISGYSQVDEGDEALRLYSQMSEAGVVPNERTFVGALKACSSLAAAGAGGGKEVGALSVDLVRRIHGDIVHCRCESAAFVGPMLVDAYLRCDSLVDARHVFENLAHRDVVSWTSMMLGYTRMDEAEIALELYARMQQEGVAADERAFVAALKACSSLAAVGGEHGSAASWLLGQVRAVHLEAVRSGCESALYVGNMLVDAYAKCGSLVDARSVFDGMPHRDVVSWNALILAYAHAGDEGGQEALQLYLVGMQAEGVVPDDRTFVGVLKACSSLGASSGKGSSKRGGKGSTVGLVLEQVRGLHREIMDRGLETDPFVGSMLIDAYAKCGSLVDARHTFEKILQLLPGGSSSGGNVVLWNAMIAGYAQMEDGEEALQLYARMQQQEVVGGVVVADDRTFIAALQACGCLARLDKGREIHAQMLAAGIDASGEFVASSVMDMYARCGSMADAHEVFDALPVTSRSSIVTWNALIGGYARTGDISAVFHLFSEARREGVRANSITFLSVLTVCSHAGLVEQGGHYLGAMSREFGIPPSLAHYSCMVDLLGRSGAVEGAMAMVKSMPVQADRGVWRSLLGACQKWGMVELGKEAFELAVRMDGTDGAPYVLMSNLYKGAREVEATREVRRHGRTRMAACIT